ncbi:MAG: hypothetical protein ACTSXV_02020, partial [Alphaproteobacteria bacterium]
MSYTNPTTTVAVQTNSIPTTPSYIAPPSPIVSVSTSFAPSSKMMILGQQKTTALRINMDLLKKNKELIAERDTMKKKKKTGGALALLGAAVTATTVTGAVISKNNKEEVGGDLNSVVTNLQTTISEKLAEENNRGNG